MMLGPDDVDDLLGNRDFETAQVEELRLFYNERLKGRSLSAVLDWAEAQLVEKIEQTDMTHTSKYSSHVELSSDVAQENFLRATKKM